MQKFTQKWSVVALLEDVQVGQEFAPADWPLHVTIADVFASQWSGAQLAKALQSFAADVSKLSVNVIDETVFGTPENQVPVLLLQKTEALVKLHNVFLDALAAANLVFNDPQYAREGFVPHISRGNQKGLNIDDRVFIQNVALVDFFPEGNASMRRVTAKFSLAD